MDLRAAASRLPVDQALDAKMASQYGLIDYESALALGATPDLIRNAVASGSWQTLHRTVYRAAAAPRTAEQELLAAVLASGDAALGSHLSGVWLWGLLARSPDVPEVSVPYSRSVRHTGFTLHRSTDLLGVTPHFRRGIPVTDPARAILDACGVVSPSVAALLV